VGRGGKIPVKSENPAVQLYFGGEYSTDAPAWEGDLGILLGQTERLGTQLDVELHGRGSRMERLRAG